MLDIARGRGTAKYLLKHHYKSLLPEAITSKKKQGGFAPMPLFFRDSVQRARLKEFILSSAIVDEFLNKMLLSNSLRNMIVKLCKREVGFGIVKTVLSSILICLRLQYGGSSL